MSLLAFLAIQAPTANFLLCNNCLLYDSKSDWALDYASPIPTYIKLPIVQQPLLYGPKSGCALAASSLPLQLSQAHLRT